MKYRAEIDGLRAFAVVPVVLYHAGLGILSGGFIGVDVFFVISGYLITTIILTDISIDRFSLARFYEKRARRILPALFFVVFLTTLSAPFVLMPGQIKDLGQSVFSIALFVSNYFFYLETDYFNPFSSNNPLLHTWSLAVEEQFYLLFPLILLCFGKRFIWSVRACLVVFFVSLCFSVFTSHHNANLSFYSIHTRAWELMSGSLVAFYMYTQRDKVLSKRSSDFQKYIVLLSFFCLVSSFVLFDKETVHPGFLTIVPVLSTCALIVYMGRDDLVTRLLKLRAVVGVGLISYSLYLVHNPVFSYIGIYFDYLESSQLSLVKLGSIPFVLVLSYISYKFVEGPFRNRAQFSNRFIAVFSIVLLSMFGALGLIMHLKNGFQDEMMAYYESSGIPSFVDVEEERSKIKVVQERYGSGHNFFECQGACRKILVIGDSFANDVFLSLSHSGVLAEVSFLNLDDPCMSEFLNSSGDQIFCKGAKIIGDGHIVKSAAMELIEKATDIIVSAKWQESTFQDGYELARQVELWSDAKVFVVGSILFADMYSMPIKISRAKDKSKISNVFYNYIRWDRVRTSDRLRELVLEDGRLNWIEKSDFFCDFSKSECDLLDVNGRSKIWDNAHLVVGSYSSYAGFVFSRL